MDHAKKTPLYEAHVRLGGHMTEFAGFLMPTRYEEGIVGEHLRVRTRVGLFDVSHMGEVRVTGPGALDAVQHLVTNDLTRVRVGRAQYTAMCAEDGTIVDDMIVYWLGDEELLICVNASNRATDFAHMLHHAGDRARFVDEGDQWGQIAVQGPNAPALLGRLLPDAYPGMKPFRIVPTSFQGARLYLATTGYTGEAGAEIYVAAEAAAALWDRLMELGDDLGVGAIGLGARDTLRLEAAYCLYGNDIDRTTTPLEAGLGWVTRLGKPEFVGRDALVAQKAAGVTRRLVGVEVFDRGIPRHGYPVLVGGEVVGHVTSGTRSPLTGRCIGLAYVPVALAEPGTELAVDCRGRVKPAAVVETPFYDKP